MKTIGLIINPVAGIGGRVGLKGSDGKEIQDLAKAKGAKGEALLRAAAALQELKVSASGGSFRLLAAPGEMGAAVVKEVGLSCETVGHIDQGHTTAADTVAIAKAMKEKNVDLLLFAGGDGTARNIWEAVGDALPVIGIPAGVKIHSAVYAINPVNTGKAAAAFCEEATIRYREGEVLDIDEDAFRQGRVSARLYGYLMVPEFRNYIQSMKSGGYSEKNELAGIAGEIADHMGKDVVYLIGPGTTTRAVMDRLGLPATLLGVDAVQNGALLGSDLDEEAIYGLVSENDCRLVITVIGGQGHIFGRGNQQFSPRVIRKIGKERIIVIATKKKLFDLLPAALVADTGDEALDRELSGYMRVITGFNDAVMFSVRS